MSRRQRYRRHLANATRFEPVVKDPHADYDDPVRFAQLREVADSLGAGVAVATLQLFFHDDKPVLLIGRSHLDEDGNDLFPKTRVVTRRLMPEEHL